MDLIAGLTVVWPRFLRLCLRGSGRFTCAGKNIHVLPQTETEEGYLDTVFVCFPVRPVFCIHGGFIYCVFGTSKDITLGPTAIMSLLCSAYIGGDPVFAVVLTLLCGIIQAEWLCWDWGEMEIGLKGKSPQNKNSFMLTETTQNFFSKMEINVKLYINI